MEKIKVEILELKGEPPKIAIPEEVNLEVKINGIYQKVEEKIK